MAQRPIPAKSPIGGWRACPVCWSLSKQEEFDIAVEDVERASASH
jgi:hypothetical protein